jgi:hypothetical protein
LHATKPAQKQTDSISRPKPKERRFYLSLTITLPFARPVST